MKKPFLFVVIAVTVEVMAQVNANAQGVWDEPSALPKRNAVVYHHEFFAGTGIVPVHNASSIPKFFVNVLTFGAFRMAPTLVRPTGLTEPLRG